MMQRAFDCLSERIEFFLASWWGTVAVMLACVAFFALGGWDGLDRFIYIAGFLVVILLVGTARRDNKAAQAKLDALTPGHDLDRLEERAEQEIEEVRHDL